MNKTFKILVKMSGFFPVRVGFGIKSLAGGIATTGLLGQNGPETVHVIEIGVEVGNRKPAGLIAGILLRSLSARGGPTVVRDGQARFQGENGKLMKMIVSG